MAFCQLHANGDRPWIPTQSVGTSSSDLELSIFLRPFSFLSFPSELLLEVLGNPQDSNLRVDCFPCTSKLVIQVKAEVKLPSKLRRNAWQGYTPEAHVRHG